MTITDTSATPPMDDWATASAPVPVLIVDIDGVAADRFVAAFPVGECVILPLDGSRPTNRRLLAATDVLLAVGDEAETYRVVGHEPATPGQIEALEATVGRTLSIATVVLRLTPMTTPIEALATRRIRRT